MPLKRHFPNGVFKPETTLAEIHPMSQAVEYMFQSPLKYTSFHTGQFSCHRLSSLIIVMSLCWAMGILWCLFEYCHLCGWLNIAKRLWLSSKLAVTIFYMIACFFRNFFSGIFFLRLNVVMLGKGGSLKKCLQHSTHSEILVRYNLLPNEPWQF